MAGNNAIQFLRGDGSNKSSTNLNPGQPYYDYTNNLLFVGPNKTDSTTTLDKLDPVGMLIDMEGFWKWPSPQLGSTTYVKMMGLYRQARCVDVDGKQNIWWVNFYFDKNYFNTSPILGSTFGYNPRYVGDDSAATTWATSKLSAWLEDEVYPSMTTKYGGSKFYPIREVTKGGKSCHLWLPSVEVIIGDNASSSITKESGSRFRYFGNGVGTLMSSDGITCRNRYNSSTTHSWAQISPTGSLTPTFLAGGTSWLPICFQTLPT